MRPRPSNILIVEDDADLAVELQEALAGEGYRVDVVSDGAQALDWLRSKRDQRCLLILDLMLPRIDGIGVLMAIASQADLRDVNVVVMTAAARGYARQATSFPSVRAFAPKPLVLPELIEQVRRWAP